jgi:two-component system nitrate/nitrite response regulator NarL
MLKVARHPDPHGYSGRPAKELSWVGESPAPHRDGPWGQLPVTGEASAFLVDSNPLTRAELRELLLGSPFEVMALAGTFDEISHIAVLKDRPALLLIDGAADHEAALRDAQAFRKTHPGGRVVVFVEDYALERVFAAYEAGVDAYLRKSISREALLKSLELVILGERFFPSDVLGLVRGSVQAATASRPDQASGAEPA